LAYPLGKTTGHDNIIILLLKDVHALKIKREYRAGEREKEVKGEVEESREKGGGGVVA